MQKVALLIVALVIVGAFVAGSEYGKIQVPSPAPAKEMIVEVTEFSTNGGFSILSVKNETIPVNTHRIQFSTDSKHVRENNNITSWGVTLYNT